MARIATLNPDGKARPYTLPSKGVAEAVNVTFRLAPSFLGVATVSAAEWTSEPFGLVVASPSVASNGRSITALVSGGLTQRYYTITAQCTVSDGQTITGVARIFVDGDRVAL